MAGGHDVWFDDRLVARQNWKQQRSEEIEFSDALVYCMAPESVKPDWGQWELARAIVLVKPVIPVLLQARTQLPDQLKKLQYVYFNDGPTGDAVARLMGGLQNLSPAQIPPAPADPKGKPPQAIEQVENAGPNMIITILRDPAFQAIFAVLGVLIAIFALAVSGAGNSLTRSSSQSTLSTALIMAHIDMDIRNGPGTNFDRIAVLNAGDHLDILGISKDDRWYKVLLPDGNTGWVVAASSAGEVSGLLGTLAVIGPTEASTSTPTRADLHTLTPTVTQIPTNGIDETIPITDISPSSVPMTPSNGFRNIQTYPCTGRVQPGIGRLNKIRLLPSLNSPLQRPAQRDANVEIQEKLFEFGVEWYSILYEGGAKSGWIQTQYIIPSDSCPY